MDYKYLDVIVKDQYDQEIETQIKIVFLPVSYILYRGKLNNNNDDVPYWLAINKEDARIYGTYIDKYETSKKLCLLNPQDYKTCQFMNSIYLQYAHEEKKSLSAFEQAFIYSHNDKNVYRHSEFAADNLILQSMIWAKKQNQSPLEIFDGWMTSNMQYSNSSINYHHPEVVLFEPKDNLLYINTFTEIMSPKEKEKRLLQKIQKQEAQRLTKKPRSRIEYSQTSKKLFS
jgi:hypothetical protein